MPIISDYIKLYNIINKKSIVAYLNLSIIIIIFQGWVYPSQLHVKINDPIYVYMDRLSTQGVLPSYMNATLPITRDYIAEMLNVLDENRDNLSVVDQKILDEFLADYTYELKDKSYFQLEDGENTYHPFQSWKKLGGGLSDISSYTANQGDHHLVVYEKEDNSVWLDVGGLARSEIQNSDSRLVYSYQYFLSVILSEKVIVHGEADLYEMLYNKDNDKMPPEFKGGFPGDVREGIYGFNKARAFDYSYGYLQYSSAIGDIIFSMEPLAWGNGIHPIILSNNVNPFPALIWTKTIGQSRFTFLHGSISGVNKDVLSSDNIDYAATYNVGNIDKYLVSHRWEIVLSKKLRGAFTEMLIYGGRDAELSYFLPSTLLWSVQHNTNNYDNILWFIETEYFLFSGIKLYSTIMIDELTTSRMFDDYMNNKWIIQGGTQFVYNVLNYPGCINIEFTAARPWVYTHKSPETGSYTHNGRSLGFEYGPNSQLLLIKNSWWAGNRNRLHISYEQLKWGRELEEDINDEYHFGNDPNENYTLANPDYSYKTGWLIGDIEITKTINFLWEYQFSNIIGLELGFSHIKEMDESVNTMSLQVNVDY